MKSATPRLKQDSGREKIKLIGAWAEYNGMCASNIKKPMMLNSGGCNLNLEDWVAVRSPMAPWATVEKLEGFDDCILVR